MKILHLSYSDRIGGAARAAYRIHRGLLELGETSRMLVAVRETSDPTVVTPFRYWSSGLARIGGILDRRIARLKRANKGTTKHIGAIGLRIVSPLRQFDPDIVQLHWITGGLLRLESLLRFRKPIVWRLADMWAFMGVEHVDMGDESFTKELDLPLKSLRWNYLPVDEWTWHRKRRIYDQLKELVIVCPSHWMAENARKSALLKRSRIEVIETGQDTLLFKPTVQKEARETWGLDPSKKYILFGAWGGFKNIYKGYSDFLKAIADLRAHGSSGRTEILLFGTSEVPAELSALLPTRALGHLSDEYNLSLAYSAADVFVAPYLRDNLPNTAMESMSCGTPCVAYRMGGITELIDHGVNGYLANYGEPKDLARGIEAILAEGREKYSKLARDRIQQKYNQDRQAQAYSDLYRSILGATKK